MAVTNSQVLPIREHEGFDHIGLKMTLSGDIAALDQALQALNEYVPLLLVESLDVWPARAPRGKTANEQKLTATLQLLTLRARE